MPKKTVSEPTQDVWEITEEDFKKILKETLGLVDGSVKVRFPSVAGSDQSACPFMLVIHDHPARTVKELDGPGPHATKDKILLSKEGKH